jgi:hypothetical protein
MPRHLRASLLAALTLLLLAVPAQGAPTTIGSPLNAGPAGALQCSAPGCAVFQTALSGAQLTSPINGVVTRWRIRGKAAGSGGTATARLRIIHPAGGSNWSFAGTGDYQTLGTGAIQTFETHLPIQSGDHIGIDCCGESGTGFAVVWAYKGSSTGAVVSYINPTATDGTQKTTTGTNSDYELLLNADVEVDADGDTYGDDTQDAFPADPSEHADNDHDGQGDNADPDDDNDGVADVGDNCPTTSNAGQGDNDHDGAGDICDEDDDNDGVKDETDNCVTASNSNQADGDGDFIGDACDTDFDNDGVVNSGDNCPNNSNADQANADGDGQGDLCDTDDDNDGRPDASDNCAFVANADQSNIDRDKLGDACDPDDDNDGIADVADRCPTQAGTGADGCVVVPPPPGLRLTARLPKYGLNALAGGGLRIPISCSRKCSYRARLILRGKKSRVLAVAIGSGRGGTAVLRLTKAGRKLAHPQSRNALALRIEVNGQAEDGGTGTTTKNFTLIRRILGIGTARNLARGVADDLHNDLPDTYGYGVDWCRRQGDLRVRCQLHVDSVPLLRCYSPIEVYLKSETASSPSWRNVGKARCEHRDYLPGAGENV